jgi:hypothetical protein
MALRRELVEISVTEQRYQAVLDVRAGSTVTDVARFGSLGRRCIGGSPGMSRKGSRAG